MRTKCLALQIATSVLLLSVFATGQTATYHLHKEASTINTTFDKLLTAGPDAKSVSLSSSSLTNKAAGEYVIKEFETQTGVPNASGVIPAGSTMTFAMWMSKSQNAGTVLPEVRLGLNSATGASLCSVIGNTGLTTTVSKITLTCTTSTAVTVVSTDRFYLWVGIDLTQTSGSNNFSGGLSVEGTLNSSTDSQITVQLPVPPPTITSLTPTTGAVGSSVVIAGTNFGATKSTSTVTFNGTSASTTAWSATSITATVPTGATTGPVVVTVNGLASNSANFTVFPVISSLTPTAGGVGSSVVIAGSNFGSTPGTSTVTFNGIQAATPAQWSNTSITAVVPSGATSGPVLVTVGGHASNSAQFTVTPVITSLAPTAGPVGTVVTINGTTFGATRGSSSVSFAGVAATPATWSDTRITAAVPAGVALGAASVVVSVTGAGSSNSATFTVVAPLAMTASPSPAANSNGWNNTNVTVTYTCTGGAPPVQCPAAQTVSTEGANQAISATATDANGATASASVTLNIDKTGPTVTITSPANNTITTASTQQVNGTVADSLSGIASAACNGSPATIQAGAVSCTATLVSGTNLIPIAATDVAGNTTTQAVAVVVGSPAITDFNPKSGAVGNVITITGTNLALGAPALAQVTLNQQGGGTIGAPVTSSSPTSVSFLIPPGATDGLVTLTTLGESAVSTATLSLTARTSFSVTAGPATANVLQGQSAAYSISLNSTNGFSQLATLSVSGLPTGVTASFNPAQITNGQISILTVNAPAGQTPGSSTLTVSASATVDGIPSTQTATATLAVQALSTSFLGRILESDAIESPIPGIRIVFLGKDDANNPTGCSGSTSSDAAGNFLFTNLPAACTGRQLVWYNGSTSTDGELYAGVNLAYTINTGQATGPEMVHLPRIDNAETIQVHQNWPSDQVLTYTTIPNITVTVYANTIFTLPDGTTPDPFPFTAVQVPVDRLPDSPVDGPGTLRAFIVAFQPDDTMASQPVSVNWPNYLNTPPGVNMELDTLDPVAGMLIKYGTGTVAGDGSQIIPDLDPAHPGHRYGIQHFDWHGPMAPTPNAMNPSPDPNGPKSGDPVDPASGLLVLNKVDISFGGARGKVIMLRTYRTLSGTPGPFGVGTNHNYGYQLNTFSFIQGQGFISLIMPDGNQFQFIQQPNGTLINTNIPSLQGAVLSTSSGNYVLRWKDGTIYNFQSFGRVAYLSSMVDRNGNTTTLVRGNTADPLQITQITDPVGHTLTLSYDGFDRITSIVDPIGRTIRYTYNGQGSLATVTDAAGGVTTYAYDSSNRITDITDARGTLFLHNDYDGNGKVIKQTAADGGVTQFAYTLLNPNASVSFSSGTGGTGGGGGSLTVGGATTINTSPVLLTTVTDPLGNQTTYHFNAQGFLVDTTDALGETASYTRDPGSNLVTSATDSLSRTTQFTYDGNGNNTSITRLANTPNAATISYTYDPVFNLPTSLTSPLGQTTSLAYDPSGNLLTITDPLTHQTTFTYDAAGELLTVKNAVGKKVQFSYSNGYLASFTDPVGNTTTQVTDEVGRVVSSTTPLGQTTTISYDPLDQINQISNPLGGRTTFARDPNKNLLRVTDALSNITNFSYDSMDRLLTRTDALSRVESYQYDLAGNLTTFTDRRGKVMSYSYDHLNRLAQASFGINGNLAESTISYNYDAGSRVTRVTDSIAGTIINDYDGFDRLTSELTSQGQISYSYDASGKRTAMTVAGQPSVLYTYDRNNRITQIAQGPTTATFGYDDAGRRISLTLPNGVSVAYSYDDASRITGITYSFGTATLGNLTYSYDQLGRRNQVGGSLARTDLPQSLSSATYDAANELTNWGGTAFSYDNNGNMLADGVNTFTWSARNQLANLNGHALEYDAYGRRIVNASGRSYLYDDVSAVQELSGSSVTGNLLNSVIIDEILSRTDASGSFSPLVDALGNSVALVNSSGSISTSYQYDPFGVTSFSGQTNANIFQYTGRENDDNGLYYYRARYYEPKFGRFTSEDPIGFTGGPNFYVYAADNPITYRDPSGRIIPLVTGAIGALAGGIGDIAGQMISNAAAGRPIGQIDWVEAGVATAVGGAAGVAAPFVATGYVGAALLGGLANLTQTVITNHLENKCTTTSQALWSLGLGLTAGLIGGPVSKISIYDEASPWLDQGIAQTLNEQATRESLWGLGNILRSGSAGFVSNFPSIF